MLPEPLNINDSHRIRVKNDADMLPRKMVKNDHSSPELAQLNVGMSAFFIKRSPTPIGAAARPENNSNCGVAAGLSCKLKSADTFPAQILFCQSSDDDYAIILIQKADFGEQPHRDQNL
jgi:hypothetical protein